MSGGAHRALGGVSGCVSNRESPHQCRKGGDARAAREPVLPDARRRLYRGMVACREQRDHGRGVSDCVANAKARTVQKRTLKPALALGRGAAYIAVVIASLCSSAIAALRGAILVAALIGASRSPSSAADAKPVPRIAFFGFSLINTSLEPTTPDEERRLRLLDDLLRQKLDASGRFNIVPIQPEVEKEIAAGPEIRNCNGCERDYAKRVDADWAAWGTVQKVSNLILNINLYIEDAQTGQMEFVKSVDIRGNTDESWRHGLDYLIRHKLLGE